MQRRGERLHCRIHEHCAGQEGTARGLCRSPVEVFYVVDGLQPRLYLFGVMSRDEGGVARVSDMAASAHNLHGTQSSQRLGRLAANLQELKSLLSAPGL